MPFKNVLPKKQKGNPTCICGLPFVNGVCVSRCSELIGKPIDLIDQCKKTLRSYPFENKREGVRVQRSKIILQIRELRRKYVKTKKNQPKQI